MKKAKNKQAPDWDCGIYKEVDGFYYYDPLGLSGCYSSHTLRDIADRLDELNKPWSDRIDLELTVNPITLRLAPVSIAPGFTPPTEPGLPGPSTMSGKPQRFPTEV